MKLAISLTLPLVVQLLAGDCAYAICCGGTAIQDFAGKRVVVADDTLFIRTAEMQLDIDGSPNAYGVGDQGVEDICNGLGPLEPAKCRGRVRGDCYGACQAAFRSWDGKLSTLGQKMCSIGLGGGGCSTPSVRSQEPPRSDWFVSEKLAA